IRIATFLPFLLIAGNAREVKKQSSTSASVRFETTLPSSRTKIMCNIYIGFWRLIFLSILIIFILVYLANVFIFPTFTVVFFNYLLRGMGLILCVAALTFPLTYLLGIEKADSISMSSTIFALGMFFLVLIVLQAMIGTPENFDEIFSA